VVLEEFTKEMQVAENLFSDEGIYFRFKFLSIGLLDEIHKTASGKVGQAKLE
jgi:hypothetical protein